MSLPLILACLWAVAANFAAMLPSRRSHWPAAWALLATAAPLLAWIFATDGFWVGLFCLVAALSILRWPALYFWRWVNRVIGIRDS